MRVEQSQVVKAPREEVFLAWADYEAWPSFSGLFTRVRVKERAGNPVHIDAELKLLGRKTSRSEKHTLTPPVQVRVEGETGALLKLSGNRPSEMTMNHCNAQVYQWRTSAPGRSGLDWRCGRWEWGPPVEGPHSMIERDP